MEVGRAFEHPPTRVKRLNADPFSLGGWAAGGLKAVTDFENGSTMGSGWQRARRPHATFGLLVVFCLMIVLDTMLG
jgi:hypothetical protein